MPEAADPTIGWAVSGTLSENPVMRSSSWSNGESNATLRTKWAPDRRIAVRCSRESVLGCHASAEGQWIYLRLWSLRRSEELPSRE